MKKKILSVLLALTMLTVPVVADTNADAPLSITAEAATKLAKPTSVQGTVKDGKITLSWKKVKGAEAYGVYKYNAKTKKYTKVKITTKTKITIDVKGKEGTYKYRIYSLDKVNGKYKKGNYASKSVKVKRDYVNEFFNGGMYGLSKKQFLSKYDNYEVHFEDYESCEIILSDGTVVSAVFDGDNELYCGAVGVEYSSDKKSEFSALLKSKIWVKGDDDLAEDSYGEGAEIYFSPEVDQYAAIFRMDHETAGDLIVIAFYLLNY